MHDTWRRTISSLLYAMCCVCPFVRSAQWRIMKDRLHKTIKWFFRIFLDPLYAVLASNNEMRIISILLFDDART